jgi:hypothetical protein
MKCWSTIKLVMAVAVTAFALAACTPEQRSQTTSVPVQAVAQQPAVEANDGRRVALNYSFSIRVPMGELRDLQHKGLAECRKLGCQILSSTLDQSNKRQSYARTAVRIAPQNFPAFESIISAPPGQVSTRNESAEDKSLPYLDIEKRLEIKSALRDRLTAMVREPGQKVGELATLEKQIAEVQGDIESATAQLNYLKTITETVRVDIEYLGVIGQPGGTDLQPLAEALSSGFDTFVTSLAAVITFVIAFIPWLPVIALAIWAIRVVRRRWQRNANIPHK